MTMTREIKEIALVLLKDLRLCIPYDFVSVEKAFDAALAAMTAERDALVTAGASMNRTLDDALPKLTGLLSERDAARSERDASNATRESQWKELQAARADAAALRAELQVAAEHACETPCRDRPESDCDKCGNHDGGYRCHFCKAKQALNGDAGRALLSYVAALEAEHEAIAELDEHEAMVCVVAPPCGGCDACTARIAHAAVEALRISGGR